MFTEGWIEFKDKRIAKAVARSLNGQIIGKHDVIPLECALILPSNVVTCCTRNYLISEDSNILSS